MSIDSRAQGHLNFTASAERLAEFETALTESRKLGLDVSELPHETAFGLSVAGFEAIKKVGSLGYFLEDTRPSDGTSFIEVNLNTVGSFYHPERDAKEIVEIAKAEGAVVNGEVVSYDENNRTHLIRIKDNVVTHREGVLVAKFDDIEVVID